MGSGRVLRLLYINCKSLQRRGTGHGQSGRAQRNVKVVDNLFWVFDRLFKSLNDLDRRGVCF